MAAKLEEQRKILREELETYSKLLKQWEECLHQFQSTINLYENDLDELGKEITKAADRVCDQVRTIEAALQKQLQEMKKTQKSIFNDHEKVLQNGIEEIKQLTKEAEDKLRSDDTEALLQYKARQDRDTMNSPQNPVTLTNPTFTPGKIEVKTLMAMIGSLTKKTEGYSRSKKDEKSTVHKALPTDTTTIRKDSSENTAGASGVTSRKVALLPEASVLNTIPTDKKYSPYLAWAGSDVVWIRTRPDRVQMMDRQGSVMRTVNTGFSSIEGMTTTPQGDLLITDSEENSIKYITQNGDVKTLFMTAWKPYGICCLHNGDVVVAFYDDGKVIQYNSTGRVVRELDKSLFTHPLNVAQNKINKQIYVIDSRLLAINMVSGKLEYEYTGPDTNKFRPRNVCTDLADHVIITDRYWENQKIHILDQDGRFLQYMMTKDQGLQWPYSIDTDNEGYAYVSEFEPSKISQIKILKYMDN